MTVASRRPPGRSTRAHLARRLLSVRGGHEVIEGTEGENRVELAGGEATEVASVDLEHRLRLDARRGQLAPGDLQQPR